MKKSLLSWIGRLALGAAALTPLGCGTESAYRPMETTAPAPEAMPPRPAPAYAPHAHGVAPQPTWPGADRFPDRRPNGVESVTEQPVSTFSVDVDTASYAFVRRYLANGQLPPVAAVRVEEMVNYFPYEYPAPLLRARPFRVTTTLMPSPWNSETKLLHIAMRGYDVGHQSRPPANVVLLIDTSGSMSPHDRLPLLQQGFRLFAEQLRDEDRVAIVTYAGEARVALEPTSGRHKDRIVRVIDGLRAHGGTAGGEGLQRAYALAERHFDREAVNRVILATDGDFNVGITDPRELERFVAEKRKGGIYLSILGVGLGNLNDALMQRLAQAGNGNAAYIDSLLEARKTLSQELASTLFPIADDVKVQVEFNPAHVAAYRLVGYETRMLRNQDFKNDKVDAGDIGAGHSVTALYEITPTTQARWQRGAHSEELAFVKVRYKLPGETASRLIEQAVRAADGYEAFGAVPVEQRFAVAVAAFGQRLRGEPFVDGLGYAAIAELASAARGSDPEGYRAEFVRLVRMTESLDVAQRPTDSMAMERRY